MRLLVLTHTRKHKKIKHVQIIFYYLARESYEFRHSKLTKAIHHTAKVFANTYKNPTPQRMRSPH